jgi:hypothetical protein
VKLFTFRLFLATLVGLIAFGSFYSNIFGAAPGEWFSSHQTDSEQLVLDGILYSLSRDSPSWLGLGQYSRPSVEEDQRKIARSLYASKNVDGEFVPYTAQFGIQKRGFTLFSTSLSADLSALHAFSALSIAIVLSLLFLAIEREFGVVAAVFFCVPLIISPWVIVFARNLYWVPALWFLPMLLSFWLGREAFEDKLRLASLFAALYVAFLVKFLSGYEYITTIAIAAIIPLVYFYLRYGAPLARGVVVSLVFIASLFGAFASSLIVHAIALEKSGIASSAHIVQTAQKRLSVRDPTKLANELCVGRASEAVCRESWEKGLRSSSFDVVARYFFVPNFLPFTSCAVSEEERGLIEVAGATRNFRAIREALGEIGFFNAINCLISKGNRFVFLALTGVVLLLLPRAPVAVGISVVLAFLAPLSWFFIAKGHSVFHYHMNYVLWYLPFVPFASLMLAVTLFGDRHSRRVVSVK